MTLDSIINEIKNAESIAILTHENPDGDAIRKCSCNVYCIKTNWKEC